MSNPIPYQCPAQYPCHFPAQYSMPMSTQAPMPVQLHTTCIVMHCALVLDACTVCVHAAMLPFSYDMQESWLCRAAQCMCTMATPSHYTYHRDWREITAVQGVAIMSSAPSDPSSYKLAVVGAGLLGTRIAGELTNLGLGVPWAEISGKFAP